MPLLSTGKFFSLPASGGGGYDVLSLPSLNRWYDPSDASTITQSGGDVSALADKSGNGFGVSQSDATRRPSTGATINGVAALTYDGVDEFLYADGNMSAFSGNDLPFTAIMVIEPATVAVNQNIFTFNTQTTTNAWTELRLLSAGPLWNVRKTSDAGSANDFNMGTPTAAPKLISIYSTGLLGSGRVNGVATATNSSLNVTTSSINRFVLGAWYRNVTLAVPFNGKIGEYILCAANVPLLDIQDAEAYLADKWGISI